MISFPGHWITVISLPLAPEGDGKLSEDGKPCVLGETTNKTMLGRVASLELLSCSSARLRDLWAELGLEIETALWFTQSNEAVAKSFWGWIGVRCSRQLGCFDTWLLGAACPCGRGYQAEEQMLFSFHHCLEQDANLFLSIHVLSTCKYWVSYKAVWCLSRCTLGLVACLGRSISKMSERLGLLLDLINSVEYPVENILIFLFCWHILTYIIVV